MIIQNEYGKINSMILMMKVGGHYATEDIKFYVLNGKFEEIKNIMSNIDFMEFEEVYISCAHEQENIMFYTCILDMMKANETAELHDLAFYY